MKGAIILLIVSIAFFFIVLTGRFELLLIILGIVIISTLLGFDINKTIKKPKKIINWLKLISTLSIILSSLLFLIFLEYSLIILTASSVIRIILSIIDISFERIPILKRNSKRIGRIFIILILASLLLYFIYSKIIITKVEYKIYNAGRSIW